MADSEKHKLNQNNQNPNITTAEMLVVLLQWMCSKVWEN